MQNNFVLEGSCHIYPEEFPHFTNNGKPWMSNFLNLTIRILVILLFYMSVESTIFLCVFCFC